MSVYGLAAATGQLGGRLLRLAPLLNSGALIAVVVLSAILYLGTLTPQDRASKSPKLVTFLLSLFLGWLL